MPCKSRVGNGACRRYTLFCGGHDLRHSWLYCLWLLAMTDALSSPFAPVLRKRKLQDRLALAGVSPEHHDKLASNVAGGLSFVASNTNSDDEYCSDSSSTEDEYESSPLDEESDSVRQVPNQKLLAASRASSNSHLRENSRKKYSCTYSSCSKSYTKPSRLTEHERSHTGQVRILRCSRSRRFTHRFNPRSALLNVASAKSRTFGRITFRHTLERICLRVTDRSCAHSKYGAISEITHVTNGFGRSSIWMHM